MYLTPPRQLACRLARPPWTSFAVARALALSVRPSNTPSLALPARPPAPRKRRAPHSPAQPAAAAAAAAGVLAHEHRKRGAAPAARTHAHARDRRRHGTPAPALRRAAVRASAGRLYAPRQAVGGQWVRRSRWRPRRTHSAAEAGTTTVAHAAHTCTKTKQAKNEQNTKPQKQKQNTCRSASGRYRCAGDGRRALPRCGGCGAASSRPLLFVASVAVCGAHRQLWHPSLFAAAVAAHGTPLSAAPVAS